MTLESIPIFVRGGAFVFGQPVVQHTGEMAGKPLEVQVFPAAASEAVIYEDDGETMAYAQGASMRRRFSQSRKRDDHHDRRRRAGGIVPSVRARSGGLGPRTQRRQDRDSGSTAMTRYTPQELTTHASGWAVSDTGFVVVKQPDNFGALRIVVER